MIGPPLSKADFRNAVILLVLAAALWAPRLQGPIDLRYDAGVYYVLGTSIAEGKGYRLLNEPGDPKAVQYPPLLPAVVAVHQKIAGTSDPAVVGHWLRYSFCGMFLLYVLAAYVMARQFLKPGLSLLVGLICCLFHYGLFMSDLLFAEIPFALVSVAFAIFIARAARPSSATRVEGEDVAEVDAEFEGDYTGRPPGERGRARQVAYFLAASVCAVAAFMLRSAGIALLAAWVGEAVFRGKFGQALLRAAVAVLPVLAWHAYLNNVTSSDEYRQPAYAYQRAAYQYYNVPYAENIQLVDPFRPELGKATREELGRRALRNLREVPPGLGQAVTAQDEFWKWLLGKARHHLRAPWIPLELVVIPLSLVGMATVVGAFVMVKRREWFAPMYIAASVALICLTPWPGQFTRYLSPLTPFLALCLAVLLAGVQGRAVRRGERADNAVSAENWWLFGRVVAVAVSLVFLAIIGFATTMTYLKRFQKVHAAGGKAAEHRLFYYDEKWAAFDDAAAWLDGRIRSETTGKTPGVIATSAPHWAYLKTGGVRKAIMPPMEADPAKSQELLDSASVKYLILDELEFLDVVKRYTWPTVEKHPALWERVYTAPGSDTHVYRRTGITRMQPGVGPVVPVGGIYIGPPIGSGGDETGGGS